MLLTTHKLNILKHLIFCLGLLLFITSCKTESDIDDSTAVLRFQFKFDNQQERLDNLGNASTVPSGNATQHPDFNALSAYFIELVPTKFTQIREGAVIYEANTQTAQSGSSFSDAVVFDEAIFTERK